MTPEMTASDPDFLADQLLRHVFETFESVAS